MTEDEMAALCDTLSALNRVDAGKIWAADIDMAMDHLDLGQVRAYGWCK